MLDRFVRWLVKGLLEWLAQKWGYAASCEVKEPEKPATVKAVKPTVTAFPKPAKPKMRSPGAPKPPSANR